MNRKGSVALVVLIIIVILVIGGVFWYLRNNSASTSVPTASQPSSSNPIVSATAPTATTTTSGDPLTLIPVLLTLPAFNTSTLQQFSYYGVTFSVPWKDTPSISTAPNNYATQLKFSGGQFVTVISGSSYSNIATTLSSTPGLDVAKIKSVFGGNVASSDYDLLMAALEVTPTSTSTGQMLLMTALKYPFFGFVGKNGVPLAIYNFSLPTAKGIELVSQDKTTSQVSRVVFLFNAQGNGAHDFAIGGMTEDEANAILASIQMK